MRFSFVVMDLNGTLVDTFDDLTDALNSILADHGREPLAVAQVRVWQGEGLRSLLRSAFKATGPTLGDLEIGEVLLTFRAVYEQHLGTRAQLYPGVSAALSALAQRGVRMSILTNKPLSPSIKLLAQLRIGHHFDSIVAGDGAAARKPDPTGLLQLMAQADANPATTLMLGGTRLDLETARHAGVPCAIVDRSPLGAAVRGMGADYVLADLQMLPALCVPRPASDVWPVV